MSSSTCFSEAQAERAGAATDLNTAIDLALDAASQTEAQEASRASGRRNRTAAQRARRDANALARCTTEGCGRARNRTTACCCAPCATTNAELHSSACNTKHRLQATTEPASDLSEPDGEPLDAGPSESPSTSPSRPSADGGRGESSTGRPTPGMESSGAVGASSTRSPSEAMYVVLRAPSNKRRQLGIYECSWESLSRTLGFVPGGLRNNRQYHLRRVESISDAQYWWSLERLPGDPPPDTRGGSALQHRTRTNGFWTKKPKLLMRSSTCRVAVPLSLR